MLSEEPIENQNLPKMEREIISDSLGIAKFDLTDYITSSKELFFGAFTKSGDEYVWESTSILQIRMGRASIFETSITVK